MKFKVGDKVKIKPIEWWEQFKNGRNYLYSVGTLYENVFNGTFIEDYSGTYQNVFSVTVEKYGAYIHIAIDGDKDNMAYFLPDMLEIVELAKEEKTIGDAIEETMNAIFDDLPTAKEIENNLKTLGFEIKESAFKTQVNGNHYTKLAIQPMEYSMKNNLNPLQHTIIKYITRYKDKNGKIDLLKAKHCIDMLVELEYKESK
jgi:hypothetical protein